MNLSGFPSFGQFWQKLMFVGGDRRLAAGKNQPIWFLLLLIGLLLVSRVIYNHSQKVASCELKSTVLSFNEVKLHTDFWVALEV